MTGPDQPEPLEIVGPIPLHTLKHPPRTGGNVTVLRSI